MESFFTMLQGELAFYVGCLNLYDKLKTIGMQVCISGLLPKECESRSYDKLYDVSLVLTKNSDVVGNTLNAEDKRLYIITGANQGGKSTHSFPEYRPGPAYDAVRHVRRRSELSGPNTKWYIYTL